MSAPDFSALVTGDEAETEAEGFVIRAKLVRDETVGEPWKEHDGHGPVSEWRTMNTKRPGELVLCRDGLSARFYDFSAACRTARAAFDDFARLRAWCNDEWHWIGVVVTAEREELELGRASLWGIESDSGAYHAKVAAELLPEALADARATLAKLVGA